MLCPPLFANRESRASLGGRDGQDEIQICGSRRFLSSCCSKTKCFTPLGSIIKYGPTGWSVVGANIFQFAERLVIRPLKRTCQNCSDGAHTTCSCTMRLRLGSVRGSRLQTSPPDPTSRLSACEREILSDHRKPSGAIICVRSGRMRVWDFRLS